MVANIDKLMYVGEAPWHGEGTYVGDKEVTAAQALRKAEMDWKVSVRELFYKKASSYIKVNKNRIVVRDDTEVQLGVVGPMWEPVQNVEAFKFFDNVVKDELAIYHTAGSLGVGEWVWILAKLPQECKIAGIDPIESYLLLTNYHAGGEALRMFFTKIRVVCQNTLMMSLDAQVRSRKAGFSQPHIQLEKTMTPERAREALGMANEDFEGFVEVANQLAQQPVNVEEIEGFLQRLLPLPRQVLALPSGEKTLPLLLPEPKQEDLAPEYVTTIRRRDLIRTLADEGKGNDVKGLRGSRWTLLNGAVEYADYIFGQDKTRARSQLFGSGWQLKQDALRILRHDDIADAKPGRLVAPRYVKS